ncbi:hypothetical protein K2173_010061 [Erythroxylum novogranatense]|uniref:Transmembrane protein n=1 Tax=Erythroxylum novogranatense TaxID=1862640 RepID=A0AAV8T103_9ROSI|nr:hypothetical protein K2173_010061 [Erythroxylum novogranatense]
MDETLKKPPLVIPKTSLFLGCFGFSGKNSTKSKPVQTHIIKTTKKKNDHGCLRRGLAAKELFRSLSLPCPKRRRYMTREPTQREGQSWSANPLTYLQVLLQILLYLTRFHHTGHGSVSNEKIILEHGKSLEHDGSPIDTNNKRLGFRQSSDAIKTRSIQRDNQNSGRPTSVSHSISFRTRSIKKACQLGSRSSDPMVGVSIITVTLLLMLLCGRVCAVLCTCAWFYFVPRLRTVVDPLDCDRKIGSIEPDLDSEEHKKRVVLEGLRKKP